MFSNGVGSGDSNEVKVALRIFCRSFHGSLIAERDSLDAIYWVRLDNSKPWKLPSTLMRLSP